MAAEAQPRFSEPRSDLALYVTARAADLFGEKEVAADRYAQLLRRGGFEGVDIEANAASNAIAAGQFELAQRIARNSDAPSSFNLDLRLLTLADALRAEKYGEALKILVEEEAAISLDFIEPFVRGWIDLASRGDDYGERGAARIASLSDTRPLSRQDDEQATMLALASGAIDAAMETIDPALARAGPRETRLRMAFADQLHALDRPDLASGLLAGEEPLLARARNQLTAGDALGMRITEPHQAFSELLQALAVDVARSGAQGAMPVLLAQVARASDPDNAQATILAGALLDRAGRPDDALALYRQIEPTSPLAPLARDSMIQGLISADRAGEAVAFAEASLSSRAFVSGDYARLGDALSAADRHEEAADAYARERGLNEDTTWQLLFLEAASRFEANQWPTARTLFESALAIAPDEPLILNFLGYAMLEQDEDVERASAYIRKASALAPDNASITDSLGWALFKTGDLDGALEALERATQQAPDDPEIHEHFGDALYTAGRRIEARFAWEAAHTYAEKEAAVPRIEDKLLFGLSDANAAP